MRVLFNTYPVAFDCPGGGEVMLLEYKAALEALGVEVMLYDTWHPQFDGADVVHYFSVQGGSMNFCSHVKRRGLPLLVSPIIWLTEENVPTFPMREIANLLRICDLILPNSEAERDQLSEAFQVSREKFAVVPNGIGRAFTEIVSEDVFRHHADLRGPFILNVANIEIRKNQRALIQAVRDLDMPLVLAGRVRDDAYFQQCMAEGQGFVRYVGALPYGGALLKSAYRGCQVFALPSLLETPGLAALEAAAQGARIVITAEGCTREYFRDMATYVDPHDTSDISAGIAAALTVPHDGALRQHVLSRYTWAKSGEALLEAYARLNRKASHDRERQ